ncbi:MULTISPECIES: HPr family phosphocarrier protein [unclassified Ruminococcus]|uniref:HPr family phosphocarrier protein n=1 Tax=unclassified Ruminococcus TaxID=2608920 RepID=UPI00210A12AA|nr:MULTISPECIES: HPr family phosphocarrier protein [unclassified Ruminococcus]MCQ4023390.1 HPr family phosphocarrier protein [Ruminococcus sp. zg-924]MCQ4115754.1 HPr family phosphocarrier protein [Ruminococcus sp. zg-921]
MVSKTTKVVNAEGFHMRPAGVFANAMGKFKSDVYLNVNGNKVNGKSLMNIIAACIKCGTEVVVECSGEDENEALAKAVELIDTGLGD